MIMQYGEHARVNLEYLDTGVYTVKAIPKTPRYDLRQESAGHYLTSVPSRVGSSSLYL